MGLAWGKCLVYSRASASSGVTLLGVFKLIVFIIILTCLKTWSTCIPNLNFFRNLSLSSLYNPMNESPLNSLGDETSSTLAEEEDLTFIILPAEYSSIIQLRPDIQSDSNRNKCAKSNTRPSKDTNTGDMLMVPPSVMARGKISGAAVEVTLYTLTSPYIRPDAAFIQLFIIVFENEDDTTRSCSKDSQYKGKSSI